MADLSKKLLADCDMSVRLRKCLSTQPQLKTLSDVAKYRGTGGDFPNWLKSCDAELTELYRTQMTDPGDIIIPNLQELTYGPKVYFATLKFYSFCTPDGADRRALTPALERYARNGWRPVGVWPSGSDGTWIEVLLQREAGK